MRVDRNGKYYAISINDITEADYILRLFNYVDTFCNPLTKYIKNVNYVTTDGGLILKKEDVPNSHTIIDYETYLNKVYVPIPNNCHVLISGKHTYSEVCEKLSRMGYEDLFFEPSLYPSSKIGCVFIDKNFGFWIVHNFDKIKLKKGGEVFDSLGMLEYQVNRQKWLKKI